LKIAPELWRKALLVWKKHLEVEGKPIGRKKFAEVLEISEQLARGLLFAIENKEIIGLQPTEEQIAGLRTALVLADLHIPFLDRSALSAVFSYLEEQKVKPDLMVLLGDVLDFFKISRFPRAKDNTKPSVLEEITQTQVFLKELRGKFPEAKIIYYEGNHERRLTTYIMQNASEIYGVSNEFIGGKTWA